MRRPKDGAAGAAYLPSREAATENAPHIVDGAGLLAEKKRQHRAFVNARLLLVLLFIGLWLVMLAPGLQLPWGFLIALVVEAGTLWLYRRLVPAVGDVRTLDRLHYVLLTAEIGFHSAMVYFLGGVSWLGVIAYIYAILYAGAFLTRWQTVLFTAALAAAGTGVMVADGIGAIPHQWFLPQGPDRYQDPRFLATSAIMFSGVLATMAFWVAWLGSEVRHERDVALRANVELLKAQKELWELNEELERKVGERTEALRVRAETDSLTGLLNRGAVSRRGQEMLLLAKRGKRPLALVMADADDFKSCNDKGGHLYGDHVLQTLANVMRGCLRGSDIVGRMGGDEFLIILPDTSSLGALHLCRRVVKRIEQWKVEECEDGLPVPSLSFGVATFPEHGAEMEEIIRVADKAMYDAKQAGGGRWKVGVCGATFVEGRRRGGAKVKVATISDAAD